jgi:transcriptional regulator with XRE-family HTH domain
MQSLREVRLAAGLTAARLAARAGVGVGTIYRVERGVGRPSPPVVRRLSAALGWPPAAIAEFRPVVEATTLRPPTLRAD